MPYYARFQWDLGEFERNGVTKTRWGTREELLSATRAAREHGIDILIDAVLNVGTLLCFHQHTPP